jgi:diguanylate cyclase
VSDPAVVNLPLGDLIGRLVRGLERGGRQWTVARRKDSLQRVLAGNRHDAHKLQQRLEHLLASWNEDAEGAHVEVAVTAPAPLDALGPRTGAAEATHAGAWPRVAATFGDTLHAALPHDEARAQRLADELRALRDTLAADGASPPLAERAEAWSGRVRRLLAHRHHLLEQMGGLAGALTASLAELAEDDSWARGQGEAMRARLDEGLTARSVRAVGQLLEATRERQRGLRAERAAARDALKSALQSMLHEVGELGTHTEHFDEQLQGYADAVGRADSLEGLAGAVHEMVESSRSVRTLVQGARERMAYEHQRAGSLAEKVQQLELELRRLSDEVSTDPLTGVANRRGLMAAWDAECARAERAEAPLAIALIDLDDFKKLNDSLGHAAGDQALIALAGRVREGLRPSDMVARFGGEEFVVLLPGTQVDEAQQTLTRLQRALSAGLFLHGERPVLVTFSAGVTAVERGERIEQALERADEALYEAKRTGKNRTCVA